MVLTRGQKRKNEEMDNVTNKKILSEEDNECSICFEETEDSLKCEVNSCKHWFCYSCISKWTDQFCHGVQECPYCRTPYSYFNLKNSNIFFITL